MQKQRQGYAVIILNEIKKIVTMPALSGFLILLTVLNCVFAFNGNFGNEIEYINAVNRIAGDKFGPDYISALEVMPVPDENEHSIESYYYEQLLAAAKAFPGGRTAKIFSEEFDTFSSDEDVQNMPFSKLITDAIGKKYEKAKTVSAQKNASGETNAVAFGAETGRVFGYATGTLGVLMLAECALVASLVILFAFSYENLNATDMIVYSTKAGRRRFALCKAAAALAVSTAVFVFIFAVGYGIFFIQNDFSSVWNAPISAYYNAVKVGMFSMPAVAWNSMTFGGYFVFSTLLAYLVMIIFLLFSCALGLVMKNSFAAFGVVAFASLFNAAMIIFPPASPFVMLLVYMFPAGIISFMPAWFQYGATLTLIPYQETVLTLFWLLIMLAAFLAALKYFSKKDIK